jgi:hypothetical protein
MRSPQTLACTGTALSFLAWILILQRSWGERVALSQLKEAFTWISQRFGPLALMSDAPLLAFGSEMQ